MCVCIYIHIVERRLLLPIYTCSVHVCVFSVCERESMCVRVCVCVLCVCERVCVHTHSRKKIIIAYMYRVCVRECVYIHIVERRLLLPICIIHIVCMCVCGVCV